MSNIVIDKYDMAQQIARDCFGFYSIEELERLRDMIAERRALANKAFFAQKNSVTGKSAEQAVKAMARNTADLKGIVDDDGWLS